MARRTQAQDTGANAETVDLEVTENLDPAVSPVPDPTIGDNNVPDEEPANLLELTPAMALVALGAFLKLTYPGIPPDVPHSIMEGPNIARADVDFGKREVVLTIAYNALSHRHTTDTLRLTLEQLRRVFVAAPDV